MALVPHTISSVGERATHGVPSSPSTAVAPPRLRPGAAGATRPLFRASATRALARWQGFAALRASPLPLAASLSMGALLVRLPYLDTIPILTDEGNEILVAHGILRAGHLPATNVDAYIGPLNAYLTAAAFALAGPSLAAARAVPMLLGTATVGLTYLVARAWFGGAAGLVAAGLLAVNGIHVLVNSHIAWSVSTTPFYAALALLAYTRWWQGSGGRWLLLTGLALGLAAHTHPTAWALAPGLALHTGFTRAAPLASPRWAGAGAALAALLPSLPLIGAALARPQHTIAQFGGLGYAWDPATTPERFLAHFFAAAIDLLRLASGTVLWRPDLAQLTSRSVWLAAGALIVGAVVAWRRRQPLPLVVLVAALLSLAAVNKGYGMLYMSRYLAWLAVPAFALIATALAAGLGRLGAGRPRRDLALGTVALLATLALLVQPVRQLHAYYARELASGNTNASLLRFAATARALQGPGEIILVDSRLTRFRADYQTLLDALEVLLALEGAHFRVRAAPDLLGTHWLTESQAPRPPLALPPTPLLVSDEVMGHPRARLLVYRLGVARWP